MPRRSTTHPTDDDLVGAIRARWDGHDVELSDLHVTQSDEHLVAQGDRSDAAPPGSDAAPPGNTHAGASIASGVLNMANTILGAGMLALPHAFAECGLSVGLIFLLIFASLSVLGLYLVSASADLAGRPSSFYAVAEKAVPGSGLIIDAAIAVKCFGVATSYLIIVGDSLPQALEPFGASGVLTDRRLWTLSAAVAVAPLAYLKEIDALRHTSLAALLSVLFVTVLVVLFALQAGPGFDPCAGRNYTADAPCRGSVPTAAPAPSALSALPVFVFAFTCHQNIISATGSTIVSYLLPGLCYFRLRQGHHPLRYAALGMFLLGLCIMGMSLARIVAKLGE